MGENEEGGTDRGHHLLLAPLSDRIHASPPETGAGRWSDRRSTAGPEHGRTRPSGRLTGSVAAGAVRAREAPISGRPFCEWVRWGTGWASAARAGWPPGPHGAEVVSMAVTEWPSCCRQVPIGKRAGCHGPPGSHAPLSRHAVTRPSAVGQSATTTDDEKTALHTTAAGPATALRPGRGREEGRAAGGGRR